MEKEIIYVIYDMEEKINWNEFPNQYLYKDGIYYVPKKRFVEMPYIVNDLKKENTKVIVII